MTRRPTSLPVSLPPRGIRRLAAAEYVGVSASKFDEMVRDGRMPGPVTIDGCVIWDVRELDVAFDNLPVRGDADSVGNPFDEFVA